MDTSLTIISTNLNNNILDNYKEYHAINDSFSYGELLNYKKIIFFNILNNLKEDKVKKLFAYLDENNIKYINIVNNLELSLYTKYLVVYDKDKIVLEGNTLDILKKEKELKKLGFTLPFMVQLSIFLNDYNLLNKIVLDKESLKSLLWK